MIVSYLIYTTFNTDKGVPIYMKYKSLKVQGNVLFQGNEAGGITATIPE